VKSGKIFQGVFYLSRTNFLEGTVNVEGRDPILVQVRRSHQDGDILRVLLVSPHPQIVHAGYCMLEELKTI
jgi:hypothetical protein